jgi:hypothetical protein
MKRFWILMTGAIPLALATPAVAGHGSGYRGPVIYHQTHNPGFIGAGHRVGFTEKLFGRNIRGNFGQLRGTFLDRGVNGRHFRDHRYARSHRGRALGHQIGRGHLMHRGRGLGHRNHDHTYWDNYYSRFPWFYRYDRDDRRNKDRFRDRWHHRRHTHNGRQCDIDHDKKWDNNDHGKKNRHDRGHRRHARNR